MLPGGGTTSCKFRRASVAVKAVCHSVLLRAREHNLKSALRVFPGDAEVPISDRSHMKNPQGTPDCLYWTNPMGEIHPKKRIGTFSSGVIAGSQSKQHSLFPLESIECLPPQSIVRTVSFTAGEGFNCP